MKNLIRFIYLNAYSFLLLFCAVLSICIPLYKGCKYLIFAQILSFFWFLNHSIRLFSTWNDKKIKYKILINKNKETFRSESFKIFMEAPCGRLLTKAVLKDLGLQARYKELKVYQKPFISSMKENCKTKKTVIYINKDFQNNK